MHRTIIFYGDSNTYGFDPRGFIAGRYKEEKIWTSLLQKALGQSWTVVNEGMNGRRLPDEAGGYHYVETLLKRLEKTDVFAVMLGSNDLLCTNKPNADKAVEKMKQLLSWLLQRKDHPQILIIAPHHIGTADHEDPYFRRFYEESIRMNEGFRAAADQYNVFFADAALWHTETAFDEVHFSEAGHGTFAVHMAQTIQHFWPGNS